MAYSPKYISESDIPVQIPDDFTSQEKLDAIELAESIIELDLNEGKQLDTVLTVHKAAVKQRATCELVKGTESNDDVALGDLDDSGRTKSQYANDSFCKHYEVLKEKIKIATEAADSGSYVYNTSKSERRKQIEDALEDIEVDLDEEFARRESW